MTHFPFLVSLLAGLASLSRGYWEGGQTQPARWFLALGAFWLLARIRRWRWFFSLGLFAALAAAGYGLWIGLSGGWMLAGALGGFFAWALADFERRLRDSAPGDVSALTRRHLLRLGLLAALGLAWSLLGMFYWWRFSLEWLGYAAILAGLGVGLLISRSHRGGM